MQWKAKLELLFTDCNDDDRSTASGFEKSIKYDHDLVLIWLESITGDGRNIRLHNVKVEKFDYTLSKDDW